MELLGAENPIWVGADILGASGLTFVEMPIWRPEHGELASLMDLSHDHARAAGLELTAPEVTIRETREWSLAQLDFEPALPREKERELIRIARARQRD